MPLDVFEALSKPPVIIGGRASAQIEREPKPCGQERVPKYSDRDYATEYILEEEKKYKSYGTKIVRDEERHGAMSEVDTVTNCVSEIPDVSAERRMNAYDDSAFDSCKKCPTLPINEYKRKILSMIEAYKVIIVKGATGCGKTTRIPQFILDECREKREPCNIVVTQPRRLAAISVAKRVCEERNWQVGTIVGYQIGQQRVANENTCITYCTTGVLLQKLVKEKSLIGYTHIILDEIHERNAEMDFLLIIVRKFLNTVSRNVKVILMSATISTDSFSEYFYSIHNNERFQAPVLQTRRDVNFPVKIYYLNNCTSIPEAKLMKPDGPDITKKGYITAVRILTALDKMDKRDAEQKKTKLVKGSVLVFLPGLYEIEEMKRHLDSMNESNAEYSSPQKGEHKWWIVPLHSSITAQEQDTVFKNPPADHRKIILSTNIAESSLTVPDIRYVIDFCLTKVVVTDHKTNLSSLQLCWASKNSLTQRSGRVGRVMEGRVYRLIEEAFYEDLDEEAVPEMLRCPLDRLVLQAKLLEQGPPKAIFALALNQPDLRNIAQTVLTLKEIGALMITVSVEEKPGEKKHHMDDFDGDLTLFGREAAKLPMDLRLAKLIFFGDLFNVFEECVAMACAMSVKNVFSTPFQEYLKAYNSKLAWANSTCSDSIAFLNAFTLWKKKRVEGLFKMRDEEKWCRDRFLQLKILREIWTLHADVMVRLKHSEVINQVKKKPILNPMQKNLFLKLAIAAAFYPNYFLRGFHGGQVDEKEAVATLCGHDPYTSVYLQGMPINQPGILYTKSIEKHFKEVSSRVNVKFDAGSKVLINFGHSSIEKFEGNCLAIPGKIDLAVYRAVKMRQLKPEIRIPVLNPEKADVKLQNYIEKYKENKLQVHDMPFFENLVPWPWNKNSDDTSTGVIEIIITHVETPSRFWAMSTSEMARDLISSQADLLRRPGSVIPVEGAIKVGGIYAVLDSRDRRPMYYRCRVISHKNYNQTYDVFFIDYGDIRTGVIRDEIKAFSPALLNDHLLDKIPDLAIEFSLVKVQPTADCEEKWPSTAISLVKKYMKKEPGKHLYAKIYSIVNDVVRIKLYYCRENDQVDQTCSINEELIQQKLADEAEEPFLSKQDHMARINLQNMIEEGTAQMSQSRNLTEKEELIEQLSTLDIEEPKREECSQEAILKGPYSPLEMRIFSAARCSLPKLALIDRNSVNSILLDTNPLDEHERMVISAFVTINSAGDKLSLRDTTIMPSLPGLPALVCLMFSPMVELRCDPEYTRFTGALCGLGYDKTTGEALNPDNDIEIVFDIDITLETVVKINKIRYWLCRAFGSSDGRKHDDDYKARECHEKLVEYITSLIWQKWVPQELHYHTETYKWNLLPHDKLLNPCIEEGDEMTEPADDFTSVYRLVWGIELDGDPRNRAEIVKKNIEQLNNFAEGRINVKHFECILCQKTIPNKMNALLHLKSGLHKARAQKYDCISDENSDSNEYAEERDMY